MYSSLGPIVVSYGPMPLLLQIGLHRTDYCTFLLERHGVNHMGCLAHVFTVVLCVLLFVLKVMSLFTDKIHISTISHSFKINNRRTLLFHVAQYEDDIIGRELNLSENCPIVKGVETRTFRTTGPKSIKINQLVY